MVYALFTLPVKNKRDLLRARQLVRRAADLLGFDSTDQMCLAAAAFDLACQVHAASGRGTVRCEIAEDCFNVVCLQVAGARQFPGIDQPPIQRISKRLPAGAAASIDDVPWMLKKTAELAPLDVFDEVRKINQELLRTLVELARQRGVQEIQMGPNAA
jgi:hypothetical protein